MIKDQENQEKKETKKNGKIRNARNANAEKDNTTGDGDSEYDNQKA